MMMAWQNSGKRVSVGGQKHDRRLRMVTARSQLLIKQLYEERERARREAADLRKEVAAHAGQLQQLRENVETLKRHEQELRAMLLGAHDQLMRRAEDIRVDLGTKLYQSEAHHLGSHASQPAHEARAIVPPVTENPRPAGMHADLEQLNKNLAYQWVVDRVREVADAVVPPHATVAVVSKGDDKLLELGSGRRGWHFPQDEDGIYAGYYPADGSEAISHLEDLREKGAEYLLFPRTSFWWLERYREFGEHLDSYYRRAWDDESYIIYQLGDSATSGEDGAS